MKKTLLKILTVLGILMVAVALFSLRQLSEPLVGGMEVAIEVPDDDTLVGTYYEYVPWSPEEKEEMEKLGLTRLWDQGFGILLLEGFGSDQTALRPLVSSFAGGGYSVLTFDFSGHGRSPGGLDFDNASTDRMAKQVLAAEAKLKKLSGLSSEEIVYVGHSLGARVGLQAAMMSEQPPAALILLGTQVNLDSNQQAEFFTGTQDLDLDWVQELGPENPNTDIFLLSGEWDDILTPESARLLAEKLSENQDPIGTHNLVFQVCPTRYLTITDSQLHNYEIYANLSIRCLIGGPEYGPAWIGLCDDTWHSLDETGQVESILSMLETDEHFGILEGSSLYVPFWFLGIAGLFLALIAGSTLTDKPARPAPSAAVTRVGWFIGGKLLLWVPALIPGALIASAVFFAPLGTPAFNLYYIGFFGGYGVLLWFLYRIGKMPGVVGRLTLKGNPQADPQRAYLGGLVFILVLLAVSLMARSGWWYTFPLNHRFIWLLVFTPITALGFMIGFREIEMLRASQPGRPWLVWVNALVGLFPFFLYTAFLASLGSLSGVVGSLQGLLILALAIVIGALVEKLSARPWMAALMQAFLLYWLILPQGVLFR